MRKLHQKLCPKARSKGNGTFCFWHVLFMNNDHTCGNYTSLSRWQTMASPTRVLKTPYFTTRATIYQHSKLRWAVETDIRIMTNIGLKDTIDSRHNPVQYTSFSTQHEIKKVRIWFILWTRKAHPIPRPYGRATGRPFWVLWGIIKIDRDKSRVHSVFLTEINGWR